MGKGSKARRKPKHRNKATQHALGTTATGPTPDAPSRAVRPPPERAQHGKVILPFGVGKGDRPATVEGGDMVAKIYENGDISYTQEQAARSFEQLHADYVSDLGISTGRSCLDIGPVGHDEGEGNPEVAARYKKIVRALGMQRDAELRLVVLGSRKPRSLPMLRDALNVVANGC